MNPHIGKYARSVESGWLGKVVGVHKSDPTLLEMKGVNELCRTIAGGHIDDWLDDDDMQWFVAEDLKFLKLV